MNELEKFKMNMKYYRELNGWSQQQLADKLCVSRPVITRLESGEQVPDLSYILSLCKAFNIQIEKLLGATHQTTESIFEESMNYTIEHPLTPIFDYLCKQPRLVASIQTLLKLKAKERRIIEDLIITTIEKSAKLAE